MPIEADDSPHSPVAEAILRTLLYADVFDFPMTELEIHHFLIGAKATREVVHAALAGSAWLAERISCTGPYYTLRGRVALAETRATRDRAAETLWRAARRYGTILAHLPFVRMVALTGSLAMRNVTGAHDDIDYLILTAPGRVWLTRALIILVVRLARLRGTELCPNYVLAETALVQDQRDLYMAHELAQMVPLAFHDRYRAMCEANAWAAPWLPNATSPYYAEPDRQPRGLGRAVQHIGELLLGGALGGALERWERHRKQRKFGAAHRASPGAAQIDDDRVKGHFQDHGQAILARYRERLTAYRLQDATPAMPPSGARQPGRATHAQSENQPAGMMRTSSRPPFASTPDPLDAQDVAR